MTITVEMQDLVCGRCALAYAVPLSLFKIRETNRRPMRCPGCGRRNWVSRQDDPAEVERRREEVKRIHDRDQAEAAMEAAMAKALATCPQLREENPEPPATQKPSRRRRSA